MQQFDLIIIGGGLVGAGLAIALRDSSLRIALVDARLPSSDDPRLFALNEASCQFLKNLHVWSALSRHAAPIHQVHVSYQHHFGAVRLTREDVNAESLGHVIPARFIEAELNETLLSLSNVTVFRPATLKTLTQENGRVQLVVEAEHNTFDLEAGIVIGADGTQSTVRKELNIATEEVDYAQSALVTRTTLQRSHQHIAYERFNANGAIAMLPLTGNECATIWSADHDTIAELNALSDEAFLEKLQKEFGYRLGRLQKIAKRHVFPLHMLRAKKAVDKSVYLLGNAAHTLHPIAAQGFNLALYEVAALVESLLEKTSKQSPFTHADLQAVHDFTGPHQSASIGLSHRLSTFFAKGPVVTSIVAPLGMLALDIASPIKKRFIKGAMGRAGRVPRLLLNTHLL